MVFSTARPAAFTLIELLVVIAIIALLAAVLFPVFAQARAKARQSACLSNARQIALAAMAYVADNDEQFMELYRCGAGGVPGPNDGCAVGNPVHAWPDVEIPKPGTTENYGWYTAPASGQPEFSPNWAYILVPYTKNKGVFACPSGKPIWRPETSTDTASYVYNSWIGDPGTARPAAVLSDIKQPSEMVLLYETGKVCAPVEANGFFGISNWDTPCENEPLYHPLQDDREDIFFYDCPRCFPNWVPKHNGGRNIVYADGHAKWAKDAVLYVRNHRQNWIPRCQQ